MTRITVDETTGKRLSEVSRRVELCDDRGHILGYFVPTLDRSLYEGVEPQISEEELRRREAQGGGRPLKDILADLERRA